MRWKVKGKIWPVANFFAGYPRVKATLWALSKKVGNWARLVYVPLENNYAYVTPVGENGRPQKQAIEAEAYTPVPRSPETLAS